MSYSSSKRTNISFLYLPSSFVFQSALVRAKNYKLPAHPLKRRQAKSTMYKKYRGFYEPSNKQTKIWRYIGFTKFVDLLDTSELYFSRLDKFEDPFEGTLPINPLKEFNPFFSSTDNVRQFWFANCWHMNEFESAAMWNIYLDTKNGIAIQSTFEKLVNSFSKTEEDIFASIVKYVDYNSTTYHRLMDDNKWSENSPSTTVNPGIYKRKSFEYENEIRVFYIDTPIEYEQEKITQRNLPEGKRIITDLRLLIDTIYIAPKADRWFKNLVESITKKYELNVQIKSSILYERKYLK